MDELLNSPYRVEHLICTKEADHASLAKWDVEMSIVDDVVMKKLSTHTSPQGVLAIVHMRKPIDVVENWSLALYKINDPGNLGTIIRIADWYGIKNIYCTSDTVDLYNSKTIQASMGSFLRVNVHYGELEKMIKGRPLLATVLNGQNIRKIPHQQKGIILIGNEANGIDEDWLAKQKHTPITIPGGDETESLNAAIATAICCERLLF